jgi:hypothetical protein
MRYAFVLTRSDDAKFCNNCLAKSAAIDKKLRGVRSEDPVDCDGCDDIVDFDARIAVVVRECGGAVFCNFCKPTTVERAMS